MKKLLCLLCIHNWDTFYGSDNIEWHHLPINKLDYHNWYNRVYPQHRTCKACNKKQKHDGSKWVGLNIS